MFTQDQRSRNLPYYNKPIYTSASKNLRRKLFAIVVAPKPTCHGYSFQNVQSRNNNVCTQIIEDYFETFVSQRVTHKANKSN